MQLRLGIVAGEVGQGELVRAAQDREISDTQFNALNTFLRTDAGTIDNPQKALDMRLGLSEGRYTALDVMQAEDLSPETKEKLLALADQVARDGGPLARADVKRERSRIDAVVGGVRGPLAVLDTASSERTATALDEFDQRVIAGEPAREVAEDVIARYRAGPPSLTALPRSRWLDPRSIATLPRPEQVERIDAAEAAALEAFEANEIDKRALRRELETLKRMREVTAEMDNARPARSPTAQ